VTARLKSCIRWFLVWSSGSALGAIYRWGYGRLIGLSTYVLRRSEGCESLYLSRGCSKREIVPGLSDIDLIVVVREGPRGEIVRRFRFLQAISGGLIPYDPAFVLTAEEMRYRWDSAPLWRYRYQEGKANWQLLWGRDVRAALPEMGERERREGCVAEMNYWWVQFARFILGAGPESRDTIVRNSICYKAVAEALNARHALRTGEHCYAKAEALRREGSDLAQRLLHKAEERFLGQDRELEGAVFLFLVDFFRDVWARFAEDPWLTVYPEVRQRVEGGPGEELRPGWLAMESGYDVRVVRSALWPMADRLVVVTPSGQELPGLDEVRGWIRERKGHGGEHLFLKVGDVVFPLTPQAPRDFHRGVLTRQTAPEVFLQLGESDVCWTSHTKWYLTDWARNRQWHDATEGKRRQLEAIAEGAARGEIVYRLTEETI
jgi:hypothetical protein